MKCSDIPEAEIIEACRAFHAGETKQTPDGSLAAKYPVKLVLAKMQKMLDKGLLECGVSLRTAWPTGITSFARPHSAAGSAPLPPATDTA